MSIRSEMASITSGEIRGNIAHTSMADSDFPCRAANDLYRHVSRLRQVTDIQQRTKQTKNKSI